MGLALFDLLASSGINIDSLQSADEQELIRLEKRIKAAQKLNDTYSQELVVQAIDTLRKRKNALLFVLSEPTIQALNKGEVRYLYNSQIEFPTGNDLEEIKALFRSTLEDDLREYLVVMMRKNEWVGMYNWLKLKPVFSQDLLTALQRKFLDIVQEMTQSLSSVSWNHDIKKRYDFISGTIFYQVMNQLDSAELLAFIYQFFKDSHSYFEKEINLQEFGHFFDKLSLYRPEDTRFHQIRKSVTLAPILKEIQSDGGSGGVGSAMKTIGIIIFILFSLARFGRSCERISNSGTGGSNYDQFNELQLRRAQKNKYKEIMDFSPLQVNLSSRRVFGNCDSVATAGQSRAAQTELIDMESRTGQILNGNLNLNDPKLERQPVVFVNRTKQDLVAYMVLKAENPFLSNDDPWLTTGLSYGAVVIKAGDSLSIRPRIMKFFLHSGKKLYGFQYNSQIRNRAPFNWAFCPISELDSALVIRAFELYKDTKESGGRVELTKNKSSYKLKWTGLPNALYDHRENNYVSRTSSHVIDLKSDEKKKR